jgi:hypothetical protein
LLRADDDELADTTDPLAENRRAELVGDGY